MGELRKDYILDRWVIIAAERAKRPHQFKQQEVKEEVGLCFFCPGNEKETPPEMYRFEKNGTWQIRAFPNKFTAVAPEGDPTIRTDNAFYTWSNNYGKHLVLVETPDHSKQLWDLSIDEITQVLRGYLEVFFHVHGDKNIKYVTIFKNHKKEAGTSIVHSHSQIIGYNKVPEEVGREVAASQNYNFCPYCDVIQRERGSTRRCFENDNFIAFCPYASRFPFEIWILPKQHVTHLEDIKDLPGLASMLKMALGKLKELNAAFNYVLHYSPTREDNLHFHIEIMPRLTIWAGFEMNGTVINPQPPEEAAKFYRGED
ncbi:galactose-1-phosphate uridylyltransferase [Candidatus Woesearchaeota archaeon]|nr:galactose-1-phosphate uridylyltransferase [Candidatus Woesearchaeota archaeon]